MNFKFNSALVEAYQKRTLQGHGAFEYGHIIDYFNI